LMWELCLAITVEIRPFYVLPLVIQ
jgi:hypothetical protein